MQKLNGEGSHNGEITAKIKIEIALFFLLAFLVRLCLLDTNQLPGLDTPYYVMLGYNFIRGNFAEGISFYWPMLYPIFVGLFSLITDYILAGYLTSIFFGSLLVAPTYLLAYNIGNRKTARLTALLLVFYPFLIAWSHEAMTDMTYTFFFMSSIYLGWRAINTDKSIKYAMTGVLLGLAYLTKATGFFSFLLMVFVILLWHIKQNKKYFRNILVLVLTFSLFAVPYIVFERIYAQQWTISIVGKYNIAHHNIRNSGAEKAVLEKWTYGLRNDNTSTLVDDFPNNIGKPFEKPLLPKVDEISFVKRIIRSLKYIYQFYKAYIYGILPPIVLILASIGFGGAIVLSSKVSKRYLYLLIFMILPVCPFFYTHVEDKYLLTVIPIAIIFSGVGLTYLFETIRNKISKVIIIFTVFSLLILDIPSLREKIKLFKGVRKTFPVQKVVGSWLRENYPDSNLCLMDLDTRTALYAGTIRLVSFPADCTTEEVIEYAKLKKVDFIIMEERQIISHNRYRQEPLLDPKNAPKDLELVYQYDKDKSWGKTLVYKLKSNRIR